MHCGRDIAPHGFSRRAATTEVKVLPFAWAANHAQTKLNIEEAGPVIVSGQDPDALDRLKDLITINKPTIVDEIDKQLEELFWIRHPSLDPETDSHRLESAQFVQQYQPNGEDRWKLGTWVYWPWRRTLSHILAEPEYFEIRTSRNKNLITKEEQEAFRSARVAIAGLSVGNNVALSLALTGGPKHLRLADFDVLGLSNMNRIRTGANNLGCNKTVLTAREIWEIDPYADLCLFREGVTVNNLDQFLGGDSPVDVLVEEMDDFYLKVQIRLACKRKKIPVVMVTDNGEGVVVSVEPFHLDPNYPMFHGTIDEDELLRVGPKVSRVEVGQFAARIVGVRNTMPRMLESLAQLKKTLFTWPQLGTAAQLAGVVASVLVRRLICNQPVPFGQWALPLEPLCDPTFNVPPTAAGYFYPNLPPGQTSPPPSVNQT